jgi:hypothetical protein
MTGKHTVVLNLALISVTAVYIDIGGKYYMLLQIVAEKRNCNFLRKKVTFHKGTPCDNPADGTHTHTLQ